MSLDTDERLLVRVRPSKNLLLVTFAVGTVLLIGVGVLAVVFRIPIPAARLLSVAVLVFVSVSTATVYLLSRRLEYAVTTHRACRAVGVTSKEVVSVALADVTDVTVVQSGWQRWLGVGEVRLAGGAGELLRFRFVEHPEWIHEQLREATADSPRSPV